MRKSFALCEAFGLTPFGPGAPARRGETAPFPSPWIPSAREGLSAGNLAPTLPSVAERPSAPCTALRAAQCKCRYGRLREGQGWGWRTTPAVGHAPVARP